MDSRSPYNWSKHCRRHLLGSEQVCGQETTQEMEVTWEKNDENVLAMRARRQAHRPSLGDGDQYYLISALFSFTLRNHSQNLPLQNMSSPECCSGFPQQSQNVQVFLFIEEASRPGSEGSYPEEGVHNHQKFQSRIGTMKNTARQPCFGAIRVS